MRASVVHLIGVRGNLGDWTEDDLAHLRRAAGALRCLEHSLDTDGGLTDEGEPWFAVYHTMSGEVVAHFARISGRYIACAPFLKGSLRGPALPELIERFLDRYRAMVEPVLDDRTKSLCTQPLEHRILR
jgi:hypothetical protein